MILTYKGPSGLRPGKSYNLTHQHLWPRLPPSVRWLVSHHLKATELFTLHPSPLVSCTVIIVSLIVYFSYFVERIAHAPASVGPTVCLWDVVIISRKMVTNLNH